MMVRDLAWGLLLAGALIAIVSAVQSRGEYRTRWHTPAGEMVMLDSTHVVAVPPKDGVVLAVPLGWLGGVPYWCSPDGWVEVDRWAGPCILADGRRLLGYCEMELSSPEWDVLHGAPPLCE